MKNELRNIIKKEFNPKNSPINDSVAMKLAESLEGFYDEEFEKQASQELKDMRDNTSKEFIESYNAKGSLKELQHKVSEIWKQVEKEDIDF